jgi:acetylornithine deacetylase/succinyl-diaminopimelate desuccinylase-like protein
MSSGNIGALASNVIPTTATAALGIRLVKGNDPATMRDLIVRHIEKQATSSRRIPTGDAVEVSAIAKVTGGADASPAARNVDGQSYARQIIAAAVAERPIVARGGQAGGRRGRSFALIAPAWAHSAYEFTDVAGKPAVVARRQPRQQPARREREPAHRKPLMRDRPLRGVADDGE